MKSFTRFFTLVPRRCDFGNERIIRCITAPLFLSDPDTTILQMVSAPLTRTSGFKRGRGEEESFSKRFHQDAIHHRLRASLSLVTSSSMCKRLVSQ